MTSAANTGRTNARDTSGADLAYEYQSAAPWLWATPKQPSLASGLGERASGAFPSGNAGEQGAA